MNSNKISELYSSGDISGYAYLSCVEREIYTVEDAISQRVFDNPSLTWARELEPFLHKEPEIVESTDTNSIQADEPLQKQWAKVQEIYLQYLSKVDVRTKSALNVSEKWYDSFQVFVIKFLTDDGEFWSHFKGIRAVGRKSILRAHELAKDVLGSLRDRKISIHRLAGIESIHRESIIDSDQEKERIIREIVHEEISELSVRAGNAIKAVLLECGDVYTRFYKTITSPDFDVWQLRNVGRKSAPEIIEFIRNIELRVLSILSNQQKDNEIQDVKTDQSSANNSNETSASIIDYNSFQPFFEARMHELSARSYHAVTNLYEHCGRSLSKFIDTVSRSDFRVTSLPAIGRKSANEISIWIGTIRGLLLSNETEIAVIEKEARIARFVKMGLKGDVEKIDEVSTRLGYFALFTAIDCYIRQLDERDQLIINTQLKFYSNQVLLNRKDSAKALNITQERTRQIRIAVFKRISQYVHWLAKLKAEYSNHSYCKSEIGSINEKEGTVYNQNFQYWAISIVWPEEYKLFGDLDVAFANPYGYELNLALIPSSLADIFDFKGFIRYFENLKEEKRVDNLAIPFRDCLLQHFIDRIYYENLNEIEKECRSLITEVIGLDVINDTIIIEKNSSRSNPEWVELIIKEAGHPMTIDEIYDALEKKQPGKSKSAFALAGAVRMNPNIVPIGRTSTYGLKEWTQGEHRGGTIREFATEYLLSLPAPIARLEDIGQYVRQFRPTSSDKSIHANLLLEANGAFALFYDSADVRYIGLANYDYGDAYRKYNPIHDSKRDFKTSCTLLEQFVAKNGRLPFHNKENEEEMRLVRFWGIQQTKYQSGQLEGEEAEIIGSMIERFAKYRIEKKDYNWLNNYNAIKEVLVKEGTLKSLTPSLRQWLINQKRAFDYGRMPESRIPKYMDLIQLIKQYAKRI